MGSSSSASLNNYRQPNVKKGETGKGTEDHCAQDLSNVSLEEVGRSEYLRAHASVPNPNSGVVVRSTLMGARLSVDDANGDSIGLLPTRFNYLVACMKKGFTYSGEVATSSLTPTPSVTVDLRHSAP
jgi:hypothetical protein